MANSVQSIEAKQICAVILAGGQGQRMGGVDKGLQLYQGRALAENALQRLRQQVGLCPTQIAVSANRNLPEYERLGVPVWPDAVPSGVGPFAGPLAGMLTAIERYAQAFDYLLTVPCDSPLFPLDLLDRLAMGFAAHGTDIAMACAPDANDVPNPASPQAVPLHNQPVFLLVKTQLAPSMAAFMAQGGRKIGAWCALHAVQRVAFDRPTDQRAFANFNTLQDLQKSASL